MSNKVLEHMLHTCSHVQLNEGSPRLLIIGTRPEIEKVIVYQEDISYQFEMTYSCIDMEKAVWWRLQKVDPSEYRENEKNTYGQDYVIENYDSITIDLNHSILDDLMHVPTQNDGLTVSWDDIGNSR